MKFVFRGRHTRDRKQMFLRSSQARAAIGGSSSISAYFFFWRFRLMLHTDTHVHIDIFVGVRKYSICSSHSLNSKDELGQATSSSPKRTKKKGERRDGTKRNTFIKL